MEGTIKVLKTDFGFIEECSTKRLWYFRFSDLTEFQMVKEGFKVRFEKKNNEQQFNEDLNKGLLKDSLTNHRNPTLRKTTRDTGIPKAPAATNIEIMAGQEE
jgi:hypothetical protein